MDSVDSDNGMYRERYEDKESETDSAPGEAFIQSIVTADGQMGS